MMRRARQTAGGESSRGCGPTRGLGGLGVAARGLGTWGFGMVVLALVLGTLLVGGCVETVVKRLPIDEKAALGQVSQVTRVTLEVQALGALGYDGFTLPIVVCGGVDSQGRARGVSRIVSQVASQVDFRAQLRVPADSPWAGMFLDAPVQPRLVVAEIAVPAHVDGKVGEQGRLMQRQVWPVTGGENVAGENVAGEDAATITLLGRAADAEHVLIEQEGDGGRTRAIGQLDLATSMIRWRTGNGRGASADSDSSGSEDRGHYDFAAIPIGDRVSGPLVFARWERANAELGEDDGESRAVWSAGLYVAPGVGAGGAEAISIWRQPGRALWPLAVSADRTLLAVLSIVTLENSAASDEIVIVSLEPYRGLEAGSAGAPEPVVVARRALALDRPASTYPQRLTLWSRQTMDPWPPVATGPAASVIAGIAESGGGLMAFDLRGVLGTAGLSMLSMGDQAQAMALPSRDGAGKVQMQVGAMVARANGVWWMTQQRGSEGRVNPVQAIRLHTRSALFRQVDQPGGAVSVILLEQDDRADRVALRVSLARIAERGGAVGGGASGEVAK